MDYRERLNNLYQVLKAGRVTAAQERLHMSHWFSRKLDGAYRDTSREQVERFDCGTAACLVGSYCLLNNKNCDHWGYHAFAYDLAGSKLLGTFLFTIHGADKDGTAYTSGPAMDLTPAAAIRRLEKTIAYLERKQALWETHPERMRAEHLDPDNSHLPYRDRCNWNFAFQALTDTVRA